MLTLEHLPREFTKIAVGIDDQDAYMPGLQFAQRDPVNFHESNKLLERDTAILAAGNPVAAELAGVEPLRHGARRHVTNPCNVAGRQYFLGPIQCFLYPLDFSFTATRLPDAAVTPLDRSNLSIGQKRQRVRLIEAGRARCAASDLMGNTICGRCRIC